MKVWIPGLISSIRRGELEEQNPLPVTWQQISVSIGRGRRFSEGSTSDAQESDEGFAFFHSACFLDAAREHAGVSNRAEGMPADRSTKPGLKQIL